jgi:hypothetical protein
MISLVILLLLRNIYIGLMILYGLFCLPCYCISDQCWLKKSLGIKHSGVSAKVLTYIDKQKWKYHNSTDFEEFAYLQTIKETNDSTLLTKKVSRRESQPLDLQCLLCLESFEKDEEIIFLPCYEATNKELHHSGTRSYLYGLEIAHFLHAGCLKEFLKTKHRCPVCQVPVTTEIFKNFQGANFTVYRAQQAQRPSLNPGEML